MARALEIPLYQLLYDGKQPPAPANRGESNGEADEWDSSGKDGHFVNKLCQSLARMSERDRQVLMSLARILIKTQRRAEAGNYERLTQASCGADRNSGQALKNLLPLAGPC
jgi:hypothetical protein